MTPAAAGANVIIVLGIAVLKTAYCVRNASLDDCYMMAFAAIKTCQFYETDKIYVSHNILRIDARVTG